MARACHDVGMRVAVTGSSGLIGSALVRRLAGDGHEVLRLVRGTAGPDSARWDPGAGRLDPGVLAGVDGVVHLAGAGIGDRRWSPAYKDKVLNSRVEGTRTIASAVAALPEPLPVLVSGSAVGYYGIDRGSRVLTEDETPGSDFLARVCLGWEQATGPAREAGCRIVFLRTGLVLSAAGGVLARQLPLFRLGFGARLGSGHQYQSWVTRQDEVSAIVHALTDGSVSGAINVTAPNPVTNADMTRAIARALHRPGFLAVPAAALRLILGREMAEETVLAGQRAVPDRLERSGFRFAHPELDLALEAALSDTRR